MSTDKAIRWRGSLASVVAAVPAAAAVAAAAAVLVAACSTAGSSPTAVTASPMSGAASGPPSRGPAGGHVVVVMEENHSYSQIVGSADAPALNRIAAQGVSLTNMYATTHPSLPNYLALTSGGTQGITSDCGKCSSGADNLFSQLQAAGITWKLYGQGYPGDCSLDPGEGAYARKHVPALYYTRVTDDPAACGNVVPMSQLDADAAANRLPTFAMVIPDLDNDMHGVGEGQDPQAVLKAADDKAAEISRTLQTSPGWTPGSRLIFTWDEGGGGSEPRTSCCGDRSRGGHIPTFVVGPGLRPGTDSTDYDQYSLLRSLEQGFGAPYLGAAGQSPSQALPAVLG